MAIEKVMDTMPREYIARGQRWYREAHEFAARLSEAFCVSFERVCGVISALSPANPWDNNKAEAETLIACYAAGDDYGALPFRTYSANVAKAWAILTDTRRPACGFFNARTGAKTQAFYYNILRPSDSRYVTIDRHMVAVASGRFGQPSGTAKLTPKQYRDLAADIAALAEKHGLTPCELQAAVWEYHLDTINKN